MENYVNSHKDRPKILVVEDDRDLSWLIKTILEKEDFSVDRVDNGNAAIAKIKARQYELMVLDYNLSGIFGLGVLEKARQINPYLIAIMISAEGNESVREMAGQLGAYAFLDKPFDIDELVRIVKKSLKEQEVCKWERFAK